MSMKLLYAEDETGSDPNTDWAYVSLRGALEEAGHEDAVIICTRDGTETHDRLEREAFDGIVLDIMMPHGENAPSFITEAKLYHVGLVIAERLLRKEYSLNTSNRIVLLSATAVKQVCERLEEIASNDARFAYMEKPTLMEHVVHFLCKERINAPLQ